MNNHLIACVLVLVGCLAVPLGGQGLTVGDTQYLNETEPLAQDECQTDEQHAVDAAGPEQFGGGEFDDPPEHVKRSSTPAPGCVVRSR